MGSGWKFSGLTSPSELTDIGLLMQKNGSWTLREVKAQEGGPLSRLFSNLRRPRSFPTAPLTTASGQSLHNRVLEVWKGGA